MNLEQEISGWDGKSSSDIAAIYIQYGGANYFVSEIIELSKRTDLQKGTTWLLKHHLENSGELKANECTSLLRLLPELQHWETRLHMLQCLPCMNINSEETRIVEMFLRNGIVDNNKFIRAWAYNGFYELARQYLEYKEETSRIFEMAMRDEAPSIKARIRNIMKKGF